MAGERVVTARTAAAETPFVQAVIWAGLRRALSACGLCLDAYQRGGDSSRQAPDGSKRGSQLRRCLSGVECTFVPLIVCCEPGIACVRRFAPQSARVEQAPAPTRERFFAGDLDERIDTYTRSSGASC